MKKTLLTLSIMSLAACGGGGSSSGAGGDNPYAGTYYGVVKTCVSDGVTKECRNDQNRITIDGNGSVTSGEGYAGTMNGERYSLGGRATISEDGVACTTETKGGGIVKGSNTTGSMEGSVRCGDARLKLTATWDMDKGAT